jgi:hypothetical protein
MATLTIDGKQYDIEKIPAEAKAKLDSARFCDKKIEQLEAELAVVRTARSAYLHALPALMSDDALVASAPEEKKPAAKIRKAITPKDKSAAKH